MTEPKFKPTKTERMSPLWGALVKHLETRLAYLRNQNDGDLDQVETGKQRGRIAEIKALLSLDKDEQTNSPPL
jgi:hypothetical protein